jgi:hypothetical protein
MWRHVVWYMFTDASEKSAASFLRVEGTMFLLNAGDHPPD